MMKHIPARWANASCAHARGIGGAWPLRRDIKLIKTLHAKERPSQEQRPLLLFEQPLGAAQHFHTDHLVLGHMCMDCMLLHTSSYVWMRSIARGFKHFCNAWLGRTGVFGQVPF